MKNLEGIWMCLLEQVSNSIRGEGGSAQLVDENKKVDAGRAWGAWGVQKL